MSNIKDTLTTIAGVLGTIGGAVALLPTQGVPVPQWLQVIGGVCAVLSIAIIGFFTGKLPNGSAKSDSQVTNANQGTLK